MLSSRLVRFLHICQALFLRFTKKNAPCTTFSVIQRAFLLTKWHYPNGRLAGSFMHQTVIARSEATWQSPLIECETLQNSTKWICSTGWSMRTYTCPTKSGRTTPVVHLSPRSSEIWICLNRHLLCAEGFEKSWIKQDRTKTSGERREQIAELYPLTVCSCIEPLSTYFNQWSKCMILDRNKSIAHFPLSSWKKQTIGIDQNTHLTHLIVLSSERKSKEQTPIIIETTMATIR